MSEQPWYLEGEKTPSLGSWIFAQMAKGAGYGALIFFGIVFFIFVLIAVGSLLPPESKEAEDPTPISASLKMPGSDILIS